MKCRLYFGAGQCELRRWEDPLPEPKPPGEDLQFHHVAAARDFLRRSFPDALGRHALRYLLTEVERRASTLHLLDETVIERLADHLVARRIIVREVPPPVVVSKGQAPGPAQPAGGGVAPPAPPQQRTSWIEIELVDDAGRPVPNERFRLKLPDGSTRESFLDQKGFAHVELPAPGTCQICFPDRDGGDWQRA